MFYSISRLRPYRLRRQVSLSTIAPGANSADINSNVNINTSGLRNLTYILILHPIAGGFALFAFIMGLIGVAAASRFSTIMMAVLSSFAALLTLIVFVIDMVLWNLVKNRLQDAGYQASLVSLPDSGGKWRVGG